MSKTITIEVDSCDMCPHYKYVERCGYDCHHPEVPYGVERGNEFSAESRHGDFPKWCPEGK
jgi:hypothetical protein